MATPSRISKPAPRNPVAVAMNARYGRTTTVMHDRRKARGGAKNRQADYREERY